MKRQIVLCGAAAAFAAALLTGCGGSHMSYTSMVSSSGATTSSGGTSSGGTSSGGTSSGGTSSGGTSSGGNTGVTTADVLSIARMPSEMGVPFTVDNGYHFTDTSDMTQPVPVDQ
jgi:hypothetical protein